MGYITSPWNYCISYLELRFGETTLATGSGFFWKYGDETFLLTNRHNFVGRHPDTGELLSPTGGIPDRVTFSALRKLRPANEESIVELEAVMVTRHLMTEQGATWIEHPNLRSQADVAAIRMTDLVKLGNLQCRSAEELEGDAILEPQASQDAFILGFPLGKFTSSPPVAIWKRATIASDPTFDPNGRPIIYVDSASRSGMSGSLVLARHIVVGDLPKKDGTRLQVIYARKDQILGIYSGRLGADNVQAQLGIVWKRHLIEETIASGVPPLTQYES